jgi:hypothetical protein
MTLKAIANPGSILARRSPFSLSRQKAYQRDRLFCTMAIVMQISEFLLETANDGAEGNHKFLLNFNELSHRLIVGYALTIYLQRL